MLLVIFSSAKNIMFTTNFSPLGLGIKTVAQPVSLASEYVLLPAATDGVMELPFSFFKFCFQNFNSVITGGNNVILLNHSGASAMASPINLVMRKTISP